MNRDNTEYLKAIFNKVPQQQKQYYPDNHQDLENAPGLIHAMIEEAIEAIRFLPSRKGWAKYSEIVIENKQAYREELADVFLFLLAILHHSDISNTEFIETVYYKQIKNERRADHKQSEID